jgi:hypothetical protein
VPSGEREQLALPKPGERGHDDHRCEQFVIGRAGDGVDLLDREHIELVGATRWPAPRSSRSQRGPVLAFRATEDAAKQSQRLLRGPVREPAGEQTADAYENVIVTRRQAGSRADVG